jgi:hypothetical protein
MMINFNSFRENKYKILSSFPDAWFGGTLKIHPSFHLESRDIVGKGNKQEMIDFYRCDNNLKHFIICYRI